MQDIHALQVEITKAKVQALQDELKKKKSIFSDKRHLESLGFPVAILGRENETRQIMDYLTSSGYIPPLISIYGRSGTGKSTIMKIISEGLSDEFSGCFVNLRKSITIFGGANLILEELDEPKIKPHEGIASAAEKIESKISETLERDKAKKFILILDEFDAIFSDTRGRPSDFVFTLLNMVENLRSRDLWLCIVAISNSSLGDYSLDDRVKSRMDSCEVFFGPYKYDDILLILRERSKKAFSYDVDQKVLELCARSSRQETGDCRRALQLLRLAGEISDPSPISEEHVKQAQRQLNDDKIEQLVKSASLHQAMMLWALAKLVLHSGREVHSAKEIFENYQCSMTKVRPLGYRRAYGLLSDLENTGLVTAKKHSQGRHGYQNFFEFTVDYNLVAEAINTNMWWEEYRKKERSEVWDYMYEDARYPQRNMKHLKAVDSTVQKYRKRFYPELLKKDN